MIEAEKMDSSQDGEERNNNNKLDVHRDSKVMASKSH